MANFKCISATGKTIERLLNGCFDVEQPVDDDHPTRAVLVRSDDFGRPNVDAGTIPARALAIFLYRIEVNKVMRAAWSGVASYDGQAHLPIDLHYLLIAFAENAEWEAQIVGKTMQCLDAMPILSGPALYPTGGWNPGETVHLVEQELGLDQMMRTFDSLAVDYRLSVSYLARIVRIDGVVEAPAATATVVTGIAPVMSS